jgi:hypothetical protein
MAAGRMAHPLSGFEVAGALAFGFFEGWGF